MPFSGSTQSDDPSESQTRPIAAPASLAEPAGPDGCPVTSADSLHTVAARAIDGLAHTTSADGWSRACAQVQVRDNSKGMYTVTVKVGWMGTLHDNSSTHDASPIMSLADEAYGFDDRHQIALRSGELVAVVSFSCGTASETEALARHVDDQLRG
jgi:flavin-binding protein dodecin